MLEMMLAVGFGLLLGLNVGVVLGYLWCRNLKRNAPVAQAPKNEADVQEIAEDDIETQPTASFWSQPADSLE